MSVPRLMLALTFMIVMVACGEDAGSDDTATTSEAPSAEPTEVAASPTPPPPPVGVAGGPVNKGVLDVSGETGKVKVTITMNEGDGRTYYEPTFIKAAPGATIAVTLENAGGADHNFSIESQKISETVEVGKTAEVEVKMPKKDGLRFFCDIPHPGMAGAFFSEEGQEVQR